MVKDMDTVSKEKKRMHVIKRRNAGGQHPGQGGQHPGYAVPIVDLRSK